MLHGSLCSGWGALRTFLVAATAVILFLDGSSSWAQSTDTFPGGFLEKNSSGEVRPLLSASQLSSLLPARGSFTFPAPWLTEAARITNGTDCGGTDCVLPVGYSYWRNMNNHVGSDTILIFLGLNTARGGTGPTLFSYHKDTDEVRNLGRLFDAGSALGSATGDGWYFSATMPHALYLNSGSRMLRYDVITRQMATVYDAATRFGSGYYIWQMHSSDDDKVHIATLRSSSTSAMLGCLAYREDTAAISWYPARGRLDECHLERSGRYMIMLDNVDGSYGEDNRIVDLTTGAESLVMDQDGAAGHADVGFGYIVNEDDWNSLPGAVRVRNLSTLSSSTVYHVTDWNVDVGHISHTNSRAGLPLAQQYACASNATRGAYPRANEIVCFRLDTSGDVLVVAPVMTNLDASGGGDDYSKDPKGNMDVTGRYMLWTSNTGTGRLDAFIVKIPAHRLVGPTDTVAPTVSVSGPSVGAVVSGTVTLSANASDDQAIAGVQFRVDGSTVGAEDTSAPFTAAWNTMTAAAGAHVVTAVARDGAGNVTTSSAVSVQVANPLVSITGIVVSGIGSSTATITWTTDRPSDSQCEFGTTSALGSATARDTSAVTAHSVILTGLTPSSPYFVRTLSRDAAGTAISAVQTFTTGAPGAVVTPPGLIGHWKFDEAQGFAAVDSSGNAYHGTLYSGVSRVPGRSGGAVSLDGVDDYIEVPHRPALNAFPVTMSAWVRTSSTGLAGLLNKYIPSSFNGYQMFVNGGNLCAWYFRDGSNNVWDGSGCTMPVSGIADNTWHHIAVVMDNTGGRLYVDGVQRASQAWKGNPGVATTSVGLSIGRYPAVARPYFGGQVDDVRLYGRALSASEIQVVIAEATPAADARPPVIGGLTAGAITASSTVIQWTTDETADGLVEYGTSPALGLSAAPDPRMSTAHSSSLAGLSPATTYYYRVTSKDAAGNAAVSTAQTFTTAAVASGAQDVGWTGIVNCSLSGTTLRKTGGLNYMADAGALSSQQIGSAGGYVEFTVPEATTLRYFGLSSGSSGTSPGELEFAVRIQAGIAEIRENGVYRGDVRAVAGDVFRITVSGGKVAYSRNGTLIHTSSAAPVFPMVADVSFVDSGSVISNARILSN